MIRTARRSDRGQALPVVAIAIVLAALLTLALGQLGAASVRQGRAQAVADVTALAAASSGSDAGRSVATANGATVRSITTDAEEVRVIVAIDGVEAGAAAKAR